MMRKVIFIIALAASVAACNNSGNPKTPTENEPSAQKAKDVSFS